MRTRHPRVAPATPIPQTSLRPIPQPSTTPRRSEVARIGLSDVISSLHLLRARCQLLRCASRLCGHFLVAKTRAAQDITQRVVPLVTCIFVEWFVGTIPCVLAAPRPC